MHVDLVGFLCLIAGSGTLCEVLRPGLIQVALLVGDPVVFAGPSKVSRWEELLQLLNVEPFYSASLIDQRSLAGSLKAVADEVNNLPVIFRQPADNPNLGCYPSREVFIP